jgi:hydroxyacylglutathione hydrolase
MKLAIIPVTPFQQNCALVWDEATMRGSVVDPGGDVPRILAEIARLGVTVESIVLTHGHIDHAGGAAELRDAVTVPIIGPDERDRFLLQGLAAQGAEYGFTVRNVLPDRWLAEGDSLTIAGGSFEVLHCPGHTPGSVVLVDRAARFALVGDVLFRGSVGRTDFPYDDGAALIEAITTKLLPLGDDMQFLCGHGPGSTIGVERQANPFLRK